MKSHNNPCLTKRGNSNRLEWSWVVSGFAVGADRSATDVVGQFDRVPFGGFVCGSTVSSVPMCLGMFG